MELSAQASYDRESSGKLLICLSLLIGSTANGRALSAADLILDGVLFDPELIPSLIFLTFTRAVLTRAVLIRAAVLRAGAGGVTRAALTRVAFIRAAFTRAAFTRAGVARAARSMCSPGVSSVFS